MEIKEEGALKSHPSQIFDKKQRQNRIQASTSKQTKSTDSTFSKPLTKQKQSQTQINRIKQKGNRHHQPTGERNTKSNSTNHRTIKRKSARTSELSPSKYKIQKLVKIQKASKCTTAHKQKTSPNPIQNAGIEDGTKHQLINAT